MARSTALVTGAAGFFGRRVAEALTERGYDVVPFGRGTANPELTLAAFAATGAPELAVHCAGGSSVPRSLNHPRADFADTVPPIMELLEFVRTRAPACRIAVASSAAVYGSAATLPIGEDAPVQPMSPYGAHKLMSEMLCRSYGSSFGVLTAIVRFFSLYGPGLRKQLLWDACQKASAGEVRFSGTGEEQRDWLHVDDAVRLLLASIERASPAAPVHNGGFGRGTSVRSAVEQVFTALGAGVPTFDHCQRAGDPRNYVADIRRARSLGWAPTIAVEDGIAQYVDWYRHLS